MNNEFKYKLALIRIKTYARPGQTLYLRDAIDLLCDIWCEANSAIGNEEPVPAAPGEASWRSPADFEHE
jgi:hypothetical protein